MSARDGQTWNLTTTITEAEEEEEEKPQQQHVTNTSPCQEWRREPTGDGPAMGGHSDFGEKENRQIRRRQLVHRRRRRLQLPLLLTP